MTRRFALVALAVAFAVPGPAAAKLMTCRLEYQAHTWSIFYKYLRGTGTISCENGERARVAIQLWGGGISFGVADVTGVGRFSQVSELSEVLGGYGSAEGHAGVGPAAEGRALTNGRIWLSQSATGRGVNLGFAFGGLTLRRR